MVEGGTQNNSRRKKSGLTTRLVSTNTKIIRFEETDKQHLLAYSDPVYFMQLE